MLTTMHRLLPPLLALCSASLCSADDALVPVPGEPVLAVPGGVKVRVAADAKNEGVFSPAALAFDESGALYLAETHRFRDGRGVEDDRDRPFWYLDDLAARTNDDRRAMLEKWNAKLPVDRLTQQSEVVRRLVDTDGDGRFERSGVFADGFNDLLDGTAGGVFALDGTVYFACIPKIWALRDKDGDGRADDRQGLLDGFGVRVSIAGHDLSGFVLGPDGRLYGTVGDRGFNLTTREGKKVESLGKGAVFRFEPDGSGFEVVHTGLRNPKELAFDDHGDAFTVDNNSDQGDKARLVYVVEGGDSGWDMGSQALHTFHRPIGLEVHPPNRWMAEKMWELRNPEQPAYIVPPVAHLASGPSGLTYHPGTGFLAGEAGRFAVCDYQGMISGSGVWSFRVEPSGAGMKLVDKRRLLAGVAASDVEYSWDGKLFVADFGGGWSSRPAGRVLSLDAGDQTWRAAEAADAARLAREGFEQRPAAELAALLKHADFRIRLRAQLALTRKPEALECFKKAAASADPVERRHGIWGLGILARRGAAVRPPGAAEFAALPDAALRTKATKELVALMKSPDEEVRAQVLKAIAEGPDPGKDLRLGTYLQDSSPRVRYFAAIAAGKLRDYGLISEIWRMLEENAGKDPYLSHAGAFALRLLARNPQQLQVLAMHESPYLRLAAVVALRRMHDGAVAAFVRDADPRVADEAIRAIHDEAIEPVRGVVASLLDDPGVEKRAPFMLRRLVHSAFRCGGQENVRRLIAVAQSKKLPVEVRREALRLLALWPEPPPVDQSTGQWSPLPKRDAAEALPFVRAAMPVLLKLDGSLLAGVFALAERYQFSLEVLEAGDLRNLAAQTTIPGMARAKALGLFAARNPPDLLPSLLRFSSEKDPAVAVAALQLLIERFARQAVKPLMAAAESSDVARAQAAWRALAVVPDPEVAALFVKKLKELDAARGVSPVALEVLEAARKRSEPEVKRQLVIHEANVAAAEDPLAKWLPLLEGGDSKRGEALFQAHPSADCMRCHRAEAEGDHGGVAGPNLLGVAKRGDRRFLLESLVAPSAKIAPGYGVLSLTLRNDAVLGGVLLAETADAVDLDSSGKTWRVKRADIKSLSPAFSAMPPMAQLLAPEEIRDLVAWLATKNEKVPAAPRAAAPETLDPEALLKK